MKPVLQIHQYALMCASTPAQYAGVEALQNGLGDCAHMCEEYDKRRQYLYKALLDLGFDCFEPEGAFYIFPDVTRYAKNGDEFVEALLADQHLAVVPGSAFGDCGMNHVRISYAYSMENLKKAMDRIEKFVVKK
jgi:aminotransferase